MKWINKKYSCRKNKTQADVDGHLSTIALWSLNPDSPDCYYHLKLFDA